MSRFFAALLTFVVFTVFAAAQDQKSDAPPARPKTLASITEKLQKIDGFVPLYWNANDGKMYLEIARPNQEFLYQVSLSTGVGSNPIGLDRGQPGSTKVVFFERVGNKILLVQPNYAFRALSDNAAERRAVEESFARSIIWGFKVEAAEGDRVLVDATGFFMRDAHGVADRLAQAEQGSYGLDESRSAFYLPRTKGFPKNTEIETLLTLTTNGRTGRLVGETAPTPRAVTVRQRHSFVELPDKNYRPRKFDPRVGTLMLGFYDYAKPITEELETRWIVRHRLEKRNPNAAMSEPVKPIIYYVDNGAPPDIRDALLEGASWWNEAFEAAGFRNAFQVKVLPPDADPMDVRYNVINWVHRSTRGWAYGSSVEDPRTGEIIRGVVTLDSQRARQDFLIGSGLTPQYAAENAARAAACDFALLPDVNYLTNAQNSTDAAAMSLARIRQLSAHEVGHTIGFAHNFAASTYNRGSVMDYPAPLVEIRNGKLNFSNAYARGIGSYDKFAVRYAYAQFPSGANEEAELEKIVEAGIANGMLFLSDDDTRPASAAHPLANLWDNGDDPIANLRHEIQVRRIGLEQFGLDTIPNKTPLSALEAKFLPLYLHHRYQLAAAVKSIGGVYYTYAVKNGNAANPASVNEIVPAARQREALKTVLETIKPEELTVPERILKLIPPVAYGFDYGRAETFPKRTNPTFDPIGAATVAADLTITALLEPNRAARLIEFNARNANNPHFREIVDALMATTWNAPAARDSFQIAIGRAVQSLLVTRLMDLAANDRAASAVRAVATEELRELSAALKKSVAIDNAAAHNRAVADDIERFLTRPDAPRKQTAPLPTPPGDPIGAND
jgi:predicted Zn-dependent protease